MRERRINASESQAHREGIEPPSTVLETAALPLSYRHTQRAHGALRAGPFNVRPNTTNARPTPHNTTPVNAPGPARMQFNQQILIAIVSNAEKRTRKQSSQPTPLTCRSGFHTINNTPVDEPLFNVPRHDHKDGEGPTHYGWKSQTTSIEPESNRHHQLGRLRRYHYATDAKPQREKGKR